MRVPLPYRYLSGRSIAPWRFGRPIVKECRLDCEVPLAILGDEIEAFLIATGRS